MKLLLTKREVDACKKAAKKYAVNDTKISGFMLVVSTAGTKSFVYRYRFPRGRAGRVRDYTIGRHGAITVDQAREEAEKLQGDYKRGLDPMARLQGERRDAETVRKAPKRSVAIIVVEFIERHAKKNRSWQETQRILNRHVVTAWGKRQIGEITRSNVNELLDEIEDESGAPMATAVLAQVRKMFNWHATRDDAFNSPIVKGMARTSPAKMKRDRVLTDDEIRTMWRALDLVEPPFRQLVRFLLLTAQRRDECSSASRTELGHNTGTWTIPAERYKTDRDNVVPLSDWAFDQWREAQAADTDPDDDKPRGPFTFSTTRGRRPFSGFSKMKSRVDAEMEIILREAMTNEQSVRTAEPALKPWRLHDLRRTAKTLMQRAGVRPDISERVLGHVISGVEGTYDRHDYTVEKRAALETLAEELRRILAGEDSKVIPLRSRA